MGLDPEVHSEWQLQSLCLFFSFDTLSLSVPAFNTRHIERKEISRRDTFHIPCNRPKCLGLSQRMGLSRELFDHTEVLLARQH
jgi:hypothetical protein